MKGKLSSRNRNQIKAEMAAVLSKRIEALTDWQQKILIDDMVTAFENRLAILHRANDLKLNVEATQLIEVENV
jgi:hypothetical protein